MKRTANHATELRTTFRRTVDSLRAGLASPCGRDTRRRWNALADLARRDLPLARLVEAHLDAVTINDELDGPAVAKGQYWGVWAAEPPDGRVAATVNGAGQWRLSGTKRWCSGAHLCSHALITAHAPDGPRLFAVDLTQQAVSSSEGDWVGNGMARADTESVALVDATATAVGEPREYLERPGFWHGAAGVAACWYGGAVGLCAPLRLAAVAGRLDDHALAHLGTVDSAMHAARCTLRTAADEIAAGAADIVAAQVRALRIRATVESATNIVLERVGRALGPAPLAQNADHAQRIADLTVYMRQSHAERDLACLGRLLGEDDDEAL